VPGNKHLLSGKQDKHSFRDCKIPPKKVLTSDVQYNGDFTMTEICNAVQRLHLTSPGIDQIHNAFLKPLSDEHLSELLEIFNQSYCTGVVPSAWREGVILPILKPGKDPTQSSSYRPITVFSCVGKLFE
jgi:hypothetical protein